jgi:hypothetical protein
VVHRVCLLSIGSMLDPYNTLEFDLDKDLFDDDRICVPRRDDVAVRDRCVCDDTTLAFGRRESQTKRNDSMLQKSSAPVTIPNILASPTGLKSSLVLSAALAFVVSIVGDGDGGWFGCSVGPTLGALLGSCVGARIGGVVGDADGGWLGCSVGATLGALLGSCVGARVGGVVGDADGLLVGDGDGASVGDPSAMHSDSVRST